MNRNIEIRSTGTGYELWATGSVGTCDYAQVLFAYGYYSLIGVIILNIVLERNLILEKVKDFIELAKKIIKIIIEKLRETLCKAEKATEDSEEDQPLKTEQSRL